MESHPTSPASPVEDFLAPSSTSSSDLLRPTYEYEPPAQPAAATPVAADSPEAVGNTSSAMPSMYVSSPQSSAAKASVAAERAERLAKNNEPKEPGGLTQDQIRELRATARRRANNTQSPERLTEWLVSRGLPEADAKKMAHNAWTQAQNRRKAAVSQQRADMGLAWLEIIGGVVLLGIGLAAGWFVGLFLVPIFDGFRRLGS